MRNEVNDVNTQARLEISFFRKIELYQLEFPDNVNLEQMKVYAASFGGPVAIMKDPKQITKVNAKPTIQIFTSSGQLISTINVSCSESYQVNHFSNRQILVEFGNITNNGVDRL